MPRLLDHDVNVALGTDGMSSNDGNDMFAALKVAGLLHKLWEIDYERWLGAREAWRMATAGGARAAGEGAGLGRIEPGRRADLVLLDLDSPVFTPLAEPLHHVVFGSTTTAVRSVLIGGRWVVRDGRVTGIDEREILAEVRDVAPGVSSRHDESWAIGEQLLAGVGRAGSRRWGPTSASTARCRFPNHFVYARRAMPGEREAVVIDRERSAVRIDHDVQTLTGPQYTSSSESIRRYAYRPEYRSTLDYFTRAWESIGFTVSEDPIGNLVARNRPAGQPVFGIGSHCDSNRNGGRWDGTLGVVCALEVCRVSADLGLDLPLQAISFLEEEGSGFGQMVLGSRIVAGRVSEQDLREGIRATDDGRSFWEHAEEAGYEPGRWRECAHILDDMTGWLELHIEQGRVLQDTGRRLGVVSAIAGYVHGDITIEGRADHAGATPMDMRCDSGVVAAETIVELERLARAAGARTVGTVGEIEISPGLINAIPGRTRISLDVRGPDDDAVRGVVRDIDQFAQRASAARGTSASYRQRQTVPATPMDSRLVAALEEAANASGEPFTTMISGAAHDTMCVAERVPAAMLFVPCRDGLSHTPEEDADPADAALGVQVMLGAITAAAGNRVAG